MIKLNPMPEKIKASLVDEAGHLVGAQHPVPINMDSIYADDLDLDVSNNYNFSGNVTDYFDSLTTVNNDATANSPKQIMLWFNRTIYTASVGFGCDDLTKTFSNIKINLLGSGQVVRSTIDYSADDTKYNSRVISFEPSALNGILLEFVTTDEIGLSNITIRKQTAVNAQLQALQPDRTLVNIAATASGNLSVSNVEDGLSIAKGDVVGTTFIHKFGNAPDFDTGDGSVTIWDGADDGDIGEMQYNYSTIADIDSVSSASAGDTFDVEVQGLDTDYNLLVQTVTLAGQTQVPLVTPLIRVFRMKNVGSVDNLGHVYCYVNTAIAGGVPVDTTTIRALMQPLNNQTLMAVFTIPANKTGYMRDWYAATSGAKRSSVHVIELRARPFGGVFQLKHVSSIIATGTSQIQHVYEEPEVFAAKTDIEMRANSDEDQAGVSAGFDIVLIDD